MANRNEYRIVGRCMTGKEVYGYRMVNPATGDNKIYTREQVAYLVGRGQVLGCTAQIYQDKVLFRGADGSLEGLPSEKMLARETSDDEINEIRKKQAFENAGLPVPPKPVKQQPPVRPAPAPVRQQVPAQRPQAPAQRPQAPGPVPVKKPENPLIRISRRNVK